MPHPVPKKLILIMIDGLTPATFERAAEDDRTPALKFLAANGAYTRGISTFPSLTPVCLSSIATGAHPDVHRIPHLVWYHRGERRVVEYGSSFAAIRAAGTRQAILDAIFNMNEQHLGTEAVTVFEALEDAGFTSAAINFTCYRGRTRHAPAVPAVARPAYGPRRFFFYNLFESDETGAPLAVFGRSVGSVDAYAAAVGRWLVTRDGFDFLVHYLPDYDFASHLAGPDAAEEALQRSDAAAETVLFRDGEDVIARREGEDVRVDPDGGLFDYPDGGRRAWAALHNPNAGDVVVSAAPGIEFADLAGRHHVGGGSHGSLRRGDSEVPMLTLGLDAVPESIVDVMPTVLRHFGVEPPPYARALARAA